MKKGFTLIELLVVITLIGVLAVAVLSALNPIEQINKARDAAKRADSSQLLASLDRYFASNEKEHPMVMTVVLLYGYFCKLLTYHYLPDKSKNNVAKVMGIPWNFIGDYEIASKNYSREKLKRIFSYLREYDLKSKGVDRGSSTEGELLKELVFKILH